MTESNLFSQWDLTSISIVSACLAIGFLLGVLVSSAFFRPAIATMIVRVKAAVFTAIGVGLLVWGIFRMISSEPFVPPFADLNIIRNPTEAIAWGAAAITGGVLYFVLGYVGIFPKETREY